MPDRRDWVRLPLKLAEPILAPAGMEAPNPASLSYRRARFVTTIPRDRLYTRTHVWVAREADGSWRVGLTKFATRLLGEVVEFDLTRPPGSPVAAGEVLGWIEGFKAINDLYCPATGSFLEVNPAIQANPGLVNDDPQGEGWLCRLTGIIDPSALDAEGYAALLDRIIDDLQAGTSAPTDNRPT